LERFRSNALGFFRAVALSAALTLGASACGAAGTESAAHSRPDPSGMSATAANLASLKAASATLAARYPGDLGIGVDRSVVLYEDFEEGSVAALIARYDTTDNKAGMTLVSDHPAYSPGSHALRLTAGGSNRATGLYKSLVPGYDELYVRYYVKYHGSGPWHHSGLWIGGYNPPLTHPDPKAGQRPTGEDRYSIGLEPVPEFTNNPMDLYTYWMGMHPWKTTPTSAVGDYYGNTLVHNRKFRMQSEIWVCYEIHLKLNPVPTRSAGAVLEIWQNDTLIRRFDDSGPYGYWIRDKFCPSDADGSECTVYRPANPTLVLLNQQWRSMSALKINYFWPQNYNDSGTSSSLTLADMVVATQRVGCTVKPECDVR
jgi:hypothetical protein